MTHLSFHWGYHGVDDLSLWSFAVNHSAWVNNIVPNKILGITLIEMPNKTKSNHRDLRSAHVWGCHVFVLEAKLQDDHKLSKWNRRSRLGQFLGFLMNTPRWLQMFVTSKLDTYHLNITLFLMIYLRA